MRREFHNLSATVEKALFLVTTNLALVTVRPGEKPSRDRDTGFNFSVC